MENEYTDIESQTRLSHSSENSKTFNRVIGVLFIWGSILFGAFIYSIFENCILNHTRNCIFNNINLAF